ncbi:hypothetical protein GCM10023149_01630 [Mucilaginibacter gynuensis]|uniref:GcrA cell cycle regulator n=1 Tax=Mucilaginibacter gynuensis TaxID=1302236 RepID=A0ABP8FP45_9SPHI
MYNNHDTFGLSTRCPVPEKDLLAIKAGEGRCSLFFCRMHAYDYIKSMPSDHKNKKRNYLFIKY